MNFNMKGNGTITINGRQFTGRNVSISNGKITVDGATQEGELAGDINVVVHGDIDKLENSCGTVTANNVGSINTQSGDVECGNVSGSVKTMSGDIECGNVGGNIDTMSGDISYRREPK